VTDEPFYKPFRTPAPPRQPQPGEVLWTFTRDRDHKRFSCELRDCGQYGIDVQILEHEDLFYSRMFTQAMDPTGMRTPREMALQYAAEERKDLEKGGS
jgi:hypothetical protein